MKKKGSGIRAAIESRIRIKRVYKRPGSEVDVLGSNEGGKGRDDSTEFDR